jgi:hypothetical protein
MICQSGCNFIPDIKKKPQYHNPFPQISKVAVMPFRNQSQEPTLSGARVSMAYYNELQSIRGFEVVPFGVVENQLAYFEAQVLKRPLTMAVDFQQFAKHLGVDAVLQGSITDYDPYYPPRIAMKVNWYASNPGFHPIPIGYGLPWGTKKEKKIPEWIRLESERALAVEQLKTQEPTESVEEGTDDSTTPISSPSRPEQDELPKDTEATRNSADSPVMGAKVTSPDALATKAPLATVQEPERISPSFEEEGSRFENVPSDPVNESELPASWPDPQGFVPRSPTAQPPKMRVQYEPIISHMRTYNGNDEDFTNALEEYFYFRDDTRFGGWQSYLQRSEDFIRFCCHQHIIETLSARGGQLESRMNLRWPINRYER